MRPAVIVTELFNVTEKFAAFSESHGRTGQMAEKLHSLGKIQQVRQVILQVYLKFLRLYSLKFGFSAYPNCVNEPFCAARTIQNYMKKYGQVMTTKFLIKVAKKLSKNFFQLLGL